MIEAVGGSACVWGWSSGGVLALKAAAAGARIEKVAVYEPPFVVDPSHRVPPRDFVRRLEELIAADRRASATRYFMTRVMGIPAPIVLAMRLIAPDVATPEGRGAHPALRGRPARGQPRGRAAAAGAVSGRHRADALLSGETSPPLLQDAARALTGVLPNAEHRTLQGQSHNVKMPALSPVLRRFFAG